MYLLTYNMFAMIDCYNKNFMYLLFLKEISGAITQFYDIRGLSPYTEYEFVVLGVNNVGRGDKSQPILITTGDPDSNVDGNQSKSLFILGLK